ncbi:hypothetical protein BT67DRAFT_391079 [Trichocladium antarcticum]|uniref:Uncharacterized protein n=1 Tax=Trichocladium antarcticum TaxID=1450529 RepID=A0AAN6ZA22_9PEZI|nr:hypothetical protein BT67DRAFT_391079 [Trichocladium antarcticum]
MTSADRQTLASEPPEPLDVVETPTQPSSGLALSRFEFETGRANDGTKILMVEWDASARKNEHLAERGRRASDWEVSWEGKGDVLPIRDAEPDTTKTTRRLYFLLPPGASIPALVSITHKRDSGDGGTEAALEDVVLRTKPMPAIFPASLTSKHDAGRRGVLHTLWAKKRLAELQAEISAEMTANGESVGLEMAMQERQWLIDHFGLTPDPGMPQPMKLHTPQSPATPASPGSPVGGRIGEKLRGLRLATSPAELAAIGQVATKTVQVPQTRLLITSLFRPAAGVSVPSVSIGNHRGPQPGSSGGGVAPLDAIVGGGLVSATANAGGEDVNEEDLFALPMSPRSPEMKRSPFSVL